jgi:hypothetical protein
MTDDLKRMYREGEETVKEKVRDIDGHQIEDDIGNAGDEVRKNLGNLGDDVRREVDEQGEDFERDMDRATGRDPELEVDVKTR